MVQQDLGYISEPYEYLMRHCCCCCCRGTSWLNYPSTYSNQFLHCLHLAIKTNCGILIIHDFQSSTAAEWGNLYLSKKYLNYLHTLIDYSSSLLRWSMLMLLLLLLLVLLMRSHCHQHFMSRFLHSFLWQKNTAKFSYDELMVMAITNISLCDLGLFKLYVTLFSTLPPPP